MYVIALNSGRNQPCKRQSVLSCLQVADRWVVPGCVAACCDALAALPPSALTLEDAIAVYAPGQGPIPPSLLNTSEFQPVLAAALTLLMQLFGDVPAVTASTTLTAQLLRLPHAALLALLSSNELATDCEDSVLMLVSWWLEGQKGGDAEEAEADQGTEEDEEAEVVGSNEAVKELMGALRYSRLSSTYLAQVLPLIPGLQPTAAQMAQIHEYRSLDPALAAIYSETKECECPRAWFLPGRPLSTGGDANSVSVCLSISTAQLRDHLACIAAMQGGGPAPAKLSAATHFGGFSFVLSFSSDAPHKLLFACLKIHVRLPRCSDRTGLKLGFPLKSFIISIQSNLLPDNTVFTTGRSGLCFMRKGLGLINFAQLACKLPGDPLQLSWWGPFIIDDRVRMTAEFTAGRVQ